MTENKNVLLDTLIDLSLKASKAILNYYHDDMSPTIKDDGSPLTKADIASHKIICEGLRRLTPSIPIISEESTSKIVLKNIDATFWLIDPLDGTKEFINKNGEFTTNIALIENRSPVMGIISAPALDTIYAGIVGEMAFKQTETKGRMALHTKKPNEKGCIVLGSRSHDNSDEMNAFLKDKTVLSILPTGSSLKFCKIAEGKAHLYPRLGRTMEWDTAAGHAILEAAGGSVATLDNKQLLYGKEGLDNPHFLASF